jgi:hypothetical protein
MLVRVRTRYASRLCARPSCAAADALRPSDGTEKVAVEEGATVGALRALLEAQFKVPYADQTLSLDPRLVRVSAGARRGER